MIPLSILELGVYDRALTAELRLMMPEHLLSKLNVWATNAFG